MKNDKISLFGIYLGSMGMDICKKLELRLDKKITGWLIIDEISDPIKNLTSLKEINVVFLGKDLAHQIKRKVNMTSHFYLVCKLDDIIAAKALPLIISVVKEMKIPLNCICIYPERWEGKQKNKRARQLLSNLRKNRISCTIIEPEKWRCEEYDMIISIEEHIDFISAFAAKVISYYDILTEHLLPDASDQNKTIITINQIMPKLIGNLAYDNFN
ncbi:MAG TPA: hypothetical protein PLT92_14350 [Ignavibacteriaceae bacterium]|nr:hypothetical protein [Ignavibacteriaceae bacterium]HOJ19741.1 hypothetical protein [Ignavibacteriaceae bacterium]